MEGPGGIQILPASSGVQELAELTPIQRLQLLQRIDCLQHAVDVLLIDTAAGITSNVTYFNVAAQEILVVVCPDPASLTDAYALMKVLHTKYGAGSFRLVVNLARGPQEAERVQRCLGEVADRFLGVRVEYLGYVLQDEAVRRAVRMQRAAQEVFPGVLIIETAAQMATIHIKLLVDEYKERFFGFGGVDNAKFRRQVLPGNDLIIVTRLLKKRSRSFLMAAQGIVDGSVAFEGDITGIFI